MASLMRKIDAIARSHNAQRVIGIRVRLGALAHMTPEHFREHFAAASRGSIAQGALVEAEPCADLFDVFLVDAELEA